MATFAERLKELRKSKGMTQEKFAENFFITKSAVSKYENGINTPESKLLQNMADFFEVSTDYLLGRTDDKNFKNLFSGTNALNKAFESFKENSNINLNGIDTTTVDKYNLNFINNIDEHYPLLISKIDKNKEYFLVRVCGNGMNMLFPDDSEVLVEKCTEFINGSIAVILLPDNELTIKKVVKNNNIITLIPQSTDPKFSPAIYDLSKDNLQVLGIVRVSINFHE